jgi:hypothetical protein
MTWLQFIARVSLLYMRSEDYPIPHEDPMSCSAQDTCRLLTD